MRYPFDSPEAKELNIKLFETLYHAALSASCDLAEAEGPYETYQGSPVSKGKLQHDQWGVTPTDLWDWDKLEKIAKSALMIIWGIIFYIVLSLISRHGIRNSLLDLIVPRFYEI